MLDRRTFLKLAAALPAGCLSTGRTGTWVNDVHSQLNRTRVAEVVTPRDVDELRTIVRRSRGPLCTAGGRHAMGGQQFASNATLIDLRSLSRTGAVDASGIVEAEAGIQWPELLAALQSTPWSIRQKQTGADRLSLGGAIAANAHGRGLTMKPFVSDVESFRLVDETGELVECSRTTNPDLFALVHGGYGLFGIVANLRLRLMPRVKVERVVEELDLDRVVAAFEARTADGFLFGDFQFSIDDASPSFLRRGVFSCYRPVGADTPIASTQLELRPEDWLRLLYLAHADKAEAYRRYVGYYLGTTGQVYWSDAHQLSFYPDDYHVALDSLLASSRATEMITELYVPRPRLADFMDAAAEELRRRQAGVVYGTVRVIERDDESYLPWAKEPYACVIFNLHVEHGEAGEARAAEAFRALIDLALARDGNYFLTYHRWARRDQVERGYPRFAEFLAEKRRFDPRARFTSEWYRHYERMFAS
jgi:FAD/FMN-containing dehydrogenase